MLVYVKYIFIYISHCAFFIVMFKMDNLSKERLISDDQHFYISMFNFSACRSKSIELLPLRDSDITCYMYTTCLGLKCCLDVDVIQRSLVVEVKIDPCNYMMTFRLEKLQLNITFNQYEWGKWKEIDLYGVLKLR